MLTDRTGAKRLLIAMLVMGATARFSVAQSYTGRADLFMLDAYDHKPVVWLPDHTKHVQLWSTPFDAKVSIYSGDRLLTTTTLEDLSAATFVKWSPDSKGVYVMWSNGGAIGAYDVRAFIVEKDRAIESPAPKAGADDFAKRHHLCQARGNNLYAGKWVKGAAELEMRPEVYPTGDCAPDAGLSADYLVSTVTGKIVETSAVKAMTPFTDGCPSDVFPTAFTTQKQIDDYRKSNNHDIPEH